MIKYKKLVIIILIIESDSRTTVSKKLKPSQKSSMLSKTLNTKTEVHQLSLLDTYRAMVHQLILLETETNQTMKSLPVSPLFRSGNFSIIQTWIPVWYRRGGGLLFTYSIFYWFQSISICIFFFGKLGMKRGDTNILFILHFFYWNTLPATRSLPRTCSAKRSLEWLGLPARTVG